MDSPTVKVTRDAIHQLIDLLDGDEDEKLKLDMLEAETPLFELIQMMLEGIEDDEGRHRALSEQVNIRTTRMRRIEARIQSRKDLIRSLMETADVSKIPLPEATVWTSNRPGQVKVFDPDALDQEFTTEVVTTKPNMAAINQAVVDGNLPKGVTITNGSVALNIRRK
jgi:hypothetical protein